MKSSYHSAEKQSEHISNNNTSKGISARAVPVLQKATSVEEEPLQAKPAQLMGSPVVQRVKVGDDKAGAGFLAASKFPGALYKIVKPILDKMQRDATSFGTVEDILAAVNANEDVMAANAVARAEAETAATVIATLTDGRQIRNSDVDRGVWGLITPEREDKAHELIVRFDSVGYCFHVHPPKVRGDRPIKGALMKGDDVIGPGIQTPNAVIDAAIAKFGLPVAWNREAEERKA